MHGNDWPLRVPIPASETDAQYPGPLLTGLDTRETTRGLLPCGPRRSGSLCPPCGPLSTPTHLWQSQRMSRLHGGASQEASFLQRLHLAFAVEINRHSLRASLLATLTALCVVETNPPDTGTWHLLEDTSRISVPFSWDLQGGNTHCLSLHCASLSSCVDDRQVCPTPASSLGSPPLPT
jgi:hypothetical protein